MTTSLGALAPIAARKRQEVEALRCAAAALWAKAETMPGAPSPGSALRGGAVIAEMKRRSPSGGVLRDDLDVTRVAHDYETGGASAISVLTDSVDFGGTLDDLAAARAATRLPLLRKDFTVDPVQVAEARVAGADWVLLIASLLADDELASCMEAADRARAGVIVEVHDEDELERALASGAGCVGINNRDLRTLQTDLNVFSRLRPRVPSGVTCVAESGARTAADVARLVSEGADAVLVGEALMRATSPAEVLSAMVHAARTVHA